MSNEGQRNGEQSFLPQGIAWPHGEQVIREMLERCHASEALKVLDELDKYVRAMGIASRFRSDRFAYQSLVADQTSPQLDLTDMVWGHGRKLSEAGYKRCLFLIMVRQVRADIMRAFADLASIRLDMEAASMEPDGTPVPSSTPAELEERDFFRQP